jgi:hypothetical protein
LGDGALSSVLQGIASIFDKGPQPSGFSRPTCKSIFDDAVRDPSHPNAANNEEQMRQALAAFDHYGVQ